jgi:hypothetical protein
VSPPPPPPKIKVPPREDEIGGGLMNIDVGNSPIFLQPQGQQHM